MLISLVLPWLTFFTIGRPIAGNAEISTVKALIASQQAIHDVLYCQGLELLGVSVSEELINEWESIVLPDFNEGSPAYLRLVRLEILEAAYNFAFDAAEKDFDDN